MGSLWLKTTCANGGGIAIPSLFPCGAALSWMQNVFFFKALEQQLNLGESHTVKCMHSFFLVTAGAKLDRSSFCQVDLPLRPAVFEDG